MEDPFTPAIAERFGARIILYGDTGTGKTFTALRMATLMGGPIAFIEADKKRALHKAPREGFPSSGFQFNHVTLDRFDYQTLLKYIRAADKHGYRNLIIDSISRFWNDDGGLLDYKDKKAKENKKGDYAWGDVNKAQRQIYNAIDDFAAKGGNVILCARRKLLFAKGRDREVIGDAPEFRDDLGYEIDLVFRAENNEYTKLTESGEQTVIHHELYVRKADIDEYDVTGNDVEVVPLLPVGRLIRIDKTSGDDELPELVDLLKTHFGHGSSIDWDAQATAFVDNCLQSCTNIKALRDAWKDIMTAIHEKLWPPHVKRQARATLSEAGNRMADAMPSLSNSSAPPAWHKLEPNSPVEEWTAAAQSLLGSADITEVDAFQQHAEACGRGDNVAPYIKQRRSQIAAGVIAE